MKKIIYLMFFCLLFASSITAETIYTNFGGYNSDFYSYSPSLFNENIENDEISDTFPLSDPQFIPLVDDLDADGINEIVVLTGNSVGILQADQTGQGVEMNVLGGYSTGSTYSGDQYSNMVIYDIDNDGYKEIIFHGFKTNQMYIIEWNGTEAINEGWSFGGAQDSMIGCGDSDGCLLVYSSYSGTPASRVNYLGFNGTSYYGGSYQNYAVTCSLKLPKLSSVPYGNNQYYFTYLIQNALYLANVSIDSSHTLHFNNVANSHTHLTSCVYADYTGTYYFTSPIVTDFSLIDPGDEVSYGYMHDEDEFKLIVYKKDMTEYDEYPEFEQADGILISNPFLANAFIDSDMSSICVAGYQREFYDPVYILDFLCADVNSAYSSSQKNTEFIYYYDISSTYNMTEDDFYSLATHSINSKQNDLSEFLTSFGVLELEDRSEASLFSSCFIDAKCDAELIYSNPISEENAIISVDATNSGYEDLISMTETNLYYIDDGFINKNAYLGYCTKIQPDIDSIWQLHKQDSSYIDSTYKVNTTYATTGKVKIGKDILNTYEQLTLKNDVYWGIKESGKRLSVLLNYTISSFGLSDGLGVLYARFASTDPGEAVNVYLFNQNTQHWDFKRTIEQSTSFGWFNRSQIPNPDYIDSNGVMMFLFNDSQSSDGTDDYLYLDYAVLESYGKLITIPSNKTNEVKLRIKPVDPEGDTVSARAILYYGEYNQQDTGWSGNFSSGTEIPFSGLLPNQSTGSSTLRLMVRDSINYYDDPYYEDFNFIVQSTGDTWSDSSNCEGLTESQYEAGLENACESVSDCSEGYDCINGYCTLIPETCEINTDCPEGYVCDDSACTSLPSIENNILKSSVDSFSYYTGIPVIILALIIIGALIYGIYKEPTIPNNTKLPISIIISIIGLGIFVYLGILSYLWIVLLILGLLFSASVFVAKYIRG